MNSSSSDKPILNGNQDRFQRYGFAKRIAHTITSREDEDCIVIGIYGSWGEGKTSVINLIEADLQCDENIIIIKFNPWQYGDENSLLKQFFQQLATAFNRKLETKKEQVGKFLKKYGDLLNFDIPIIGVNIGKGLKNSGSVLTEDNPEVLKNRIGDLLKENGKKVVVFIDDIDRLDKKEIHTVFRLVKLTADFPNTIYVLSFDEQMVASAIGERFGQGDERAGKSFLEKIIQVPLEIPPAQSEALKEFCFQQIEHAFQINKIELNEDEYRRFMSELSSNIIPMLTTPRSVVRYGNTISFSLPLLAGEVDMSDLMLIEAIKVFHPQHYKFIKSNPQYFIESYPKPQESDTNVSKAEYLKEQLSYLGKLLSPRQNGSVKNILTGLFPILNEVFLDHSFDKEDEIYWYKNKRIASPEYFSRYFSYAVIKGEISDVIFDRFILEIPQKNVPEVQYEINSIVAQSSPESLLIKIQSIEEELNWDTSVKIVKAISMMSSTFSSAPTFTFSWGYATLADEAVTCIYQIVKRHIDKSERFLLVCDLMKEAQTLEFAFDLKEWFRKMESGNQDKIFSNDEYEKLAIILKDRALEEANGQPIFETHPEQAVYLLWSWIEQDRPSATIYINDILKENPAKVIGLLLAFTPTGYSSAIPDPYKTDFTKEQYIFLTSVYDKELINKSIIETYGEDELVANDVVWSRRGENNQTDINIARQYRHWLQEDLVTTINDNPHNNQ